MISKAAIFIGHVLLSLFSSFYGWKNRLRERPLAHNPFIRVTHSSFISCYLLPYTIHFGHVEMKFPQSRLVNIDFSIWNIMFFSSFWSSRNSYSHKNLKPHLYSRVIYRSPNSGHILDLCAPLALYHDITPPTEWLFTCLSLPFDFELLKGRTMSIWMFCA